MVAGAGTVDGATFIPGEVWFHTGDADWHFDGEADLAWRTPLARRDGALQFTTFDVLATFHEITIAPLDPADWDAYRALAHRMLDESLDYLRDVGTRPAWKSMPAEVRTALARRNKPELLAHVDDAVALDEEAVRLEPHSLFANVHLAWMLLLAGRIEVDRST